jgi:hypothetical protein
MSIPDLKLIAHELGVSFSSKPSRKGLHAGIRGRISESVMLSRTRSESAQPSDRQGQTEIKEEDTAKEDIDG